MNKELELLDDFVTLAAAKGWIQLGEYFKLKDAIRLLDGQKLEDKDGIIEYG